MSGGGWTTVRVRTTSDHAAVARALFSLGAEGVQEIDNDLVTSLKDADPAPVREALAAADATAIVDLSPTPDIDWSAAWRSRIGAHRLGRLVITPPWLADQYPPTDRIVIDPGMAFGTGEHETTRGVVRLMQRVIRADDTVADLGAGSAVLAIAAAKLGAQRCIAIELDADAIGNAEANVQANGVANRVTVIEGDANDLLPLIAPVRVVLANIISSAILAMLPTIARSLATDGRAILSGILVDERAAIEAAIASGSWVVEETDQEGAWWSATVRRA